MVISEKRALVLELLQHAPTLAIVDRIKAKLRELAASGGYTEIVEGVGKVAVSKGSAGGLKGVLPQLDAEIYLSMSDDERAALPAGLVTMVPQYSRPSGPSVTVTLA